MSSEYLLALCSRSRKLAMWILLAGALLGTPQLYADDDLFSGSMSFSGFATIGLVQGGDSDLGFTRDLTRSGVFDNDNSIKQDSVLGVQVDSRFNTDWSATAQMVLRDRFDDSLEEHLEWAYLRYRADDEWSFRVGRTVVDLFTLSDYRNIGFAYLWARPPVEFYGAVIFDYVDGVDVTYSTLLPNSYLRIKIFAGESTNYLSRGTDTDELEINPIVGVNATWDYGKWSSRVGFARTTADFQSESLQQLSDALGLVPAQIWRQAPELSEDVLLVDRDFNYFNLGVTYDSHPWIVQGELSYIDSSFKFYPDTTSGYISLGYRHKSMTYFSMFSAAESSDGPRQITAPSNPPIPADPANPLYQLYLGTQQLADDNVTRQSTVSIGARWDLSANIALKMQYDRHQLDAYGSYLWATQQQPLDEDRSLDTLSVNVNLVF